MLVLLERMRTVPSVWIVALVHTVLLLDLLHVPRALLERTNLRLEPLVAVVCVMVQIRILRLELLSAPLVETA